MAGHIQAERVFIQRVQSGGHGHNQSTRDGTEVVRRVVLDPGHGGGTRGIEEPVTGYPEADRSVPGNLCPPAATAARDHGIYKQIQLDRGVRDRLDSVGRRSSAPEDEGNP